MRILSIGGDGFCGWAASLHLSNLAHEVLIVDDLSRREIDRELGVQSLTPIVGIEERIRAWTERRSGILAFRRLSVGADFPSLLYLLAEFKPDAIVHFAEQRSAPYSMKSAAHKRYTVQRNISATHDILAAMVEVCPDAHLVHLGSMGVYGYGSLSTAIPEGYLTVRSDYCDVAFDILHPAAPSSVYHLTKCNDELLFQFYNRNDGLRITDLHQGIVWGTQTPETSFDERLINRFDYDGDFGTVLNRFVVQASLAHPLTVYGSGNQKRAFIHIRDTVRCVALALQSPPKIGERVRIINQMTETFRIADLAALVSSMTGAEIEHGFNPRNEADANDLKVINNTLLTLGLKPTKLTDALISDVYDVAKRFSDRCNPEKIRCTSFWNAERRASRLTAPAPPV